MLAELPALQLLGKEEVVARRDDPVDRRPPRDAVVRVYLVMAPRIVREDKVRPVLADDAANLAAKLHRDLELAVLVAEEDEALHADRLAGGALLALARRRHLRRRHLRVVLALLAAREHALHHVRSLNGPVRHPPHAA